MEESLDKINEIKEQNNQKFDHDLNKESLPEMFFDEEEVVVFPSILDKPITELVSFDIEKLRFIFLNEIKSLENKSDAQKEVQLGNIFALLFELLPIKYLDNEDMRHELRLFVDLISIPGLFEIDYVKEYIENNLLDSNNLVLSAQYNKLNKKLLLAIVNYYSTHSKEACDKFNYILRSSDNVFFELLMNNDTLDYYFSESVMTSFSKEDLSQLFRFYFEDGYRKRIIRKLFSPEYERSLFLISQMTKKVNSLINHSAEFLDSALRLFDKFHLSNLLEDVYAKVVFVKENEEAFALTYSKNNNIFMNELINYISSRSFDDKYYFINLLEYNTLEAFLERLRSYRENNLDMIFGVGVLDKIRNNSFDPQKDIKKIENAEELKKFKNAYLYNVYKITLDDALHLKMHYGQYMDDLEKGIMDGDVPTLNMFKAIMNIVDLGEPNLDKKIDTLRIAYAKKIQEKGIYYVDDNVSLIIIEGLFNRMYMNTYNKILTKDSDVKKVIKYDDGVPILDAGLEFNFMLTSLAGVDNFFSKKVNMASKWNTASFSRGQGVCVSFINNENLGVITFEAPFLAFANIPQDSLNAMGCCDVFTDSFGYNLRKINDSRKGKNRFFIPGNILADETRYGYNEILLDRFLHNDDNNILKMQPSYVIFYKMDQSNYEESVEYKNSLKMAKDFGIPIMVIDVEKVKQHEKEVILEKEKELFSNIEPKPDLLKEIVNRYMNNYTGSLTIVGEKNNYGWTSYEEFSVSGMKNFFEKLNSFIMKIDDSSLKTKWISSLRDSYLDEKRKYDIANNTENWNNSVKDFILKDFKIESIIRDLLKTVDVDFLSAELLIDGDSSLFLSCENLSPTSQVIIDFVNFLDIGTKIKISDYNKDNINGKVATIVNIGTPEERLIENLICYYFLEDSDFLPIDDLIYNNFELGTELNICEDEDYSRQFNNFNYVVDKLSSNGKDSIGYDFELVDKVITKISTMDDKEFLKIFNPVIEQQSKKNLMTPEEICFTLLDKKGQFKVRFNSLSNQVKKVDNGNGKSK